MLAWSVRRRFFYFLTLVILLGIAGFSIFWRVKADPTCFDGRKNQDELGVDCGGGCERVCSAEVKSLRVIWTRILPVADGQYDAATLIVNPNRQHGAKSFGYVVRLVDARGILVTTRQGRAYLNPGESYVVYNSRLAVGQRQPARAIFEIVELPLWRRVTIELPNLSLKQKSFVNEPFPRLIAEIGNQTLEDWKNIEAVALLSDADGNAFAVSSTAVELLPKQSTAEIVFTWPKPFDTASPVINLYTHVNLMGD